MASRAVQLLVLLGLFSFAAAGKGVVQAGDANFDAVVLGSGKNAFVKFLAPW